MNIAKDTEYLEIRSVRHRAQNACKMLKLPLNGLYLCSFRYILSVITASHILQCVTNLFGSQKTIDFLLQPIPKKIIRFHFSAKILKHQFRFNGRISIISIKLLDAIFALAIQYTIICTLGLRYLEYMKEIFVQKRIQS